MAVGIGLLCAVPGQAQELPGGTYFGEYAFAGGLSPLRGELPRN